VTRVRGVERSNRTVGRPAGGYYRLDRCRKGRARPRPTPDLSRSCRPSRRSRPRTSPHPDAHAVFDHLYKRWTLIEVACWAHADGYWWKALETDPERARQALAYIGGLFCVERAAGAALPEAGLAARRAESKAIVDAFFTEAADTDSAAHQSRIPSCARYPRASLVARNNG
jgi:hypothetical protein